MSVFSDPVVHDDFHAALRSLGEHMADRSARFLRQLCPAIFEDQSVVPFPAEFLLGIGLASQLARWEACAPSAFAGLGLPTAKDVLDVTSKLVAGAELRQFVVALLRRVKETLRDRFLWCAEVENQVIAIQSEADDMVLNALADFLVARARNQ